MHLPLWLTLSCGAMVIVWGLYRISLGARSAERHARAPKGLFAMARRTHLLIGLVYVLMGSALIAIGFGWSPLADPPKAKAAKPAVQDGELIELAPRSEN